MAKIYTRTGDEGETSLLGGRRVRKDDLRIEAIGCVDELNAAIGVIRSELSRSSDMLRVLDQDLAQIQHRLFDLGADLAAAAIDQSRPGSPNDADVSELEATIDRYDLALPPLREFILPGGSPTAAQLHLARCIGRRGERRIVELASLEPVRGEVIRYINRLSDLLFVLARAVNQASGVPDVTWQQRPAKTPTDK